MTYFLYEVVEVSAPGKFRVVELFDERRLRWTR